MAPFKNGQNRWRKFLKIIFLVLLVFKFIDIKANNDVSVKKLPTVFVALLIRNKAHTLPYFFSTFEMLDYPKDRIHLWLRSDHNIDNSSKIINKWITTSGTAYHSSDVLINDVPLEYSEETGPGHWPDSRFQHIIELKESALFSARNKWADFIWFLDCDVFLINPLTLKYLISKNYPVVAPMLQSDGLYSNFWCGMTSNYYYKRTPEYTPIVKRKTRGCFQVPMVHSSVLIDLRIQISDNLSFDKNKLLNYKGPLDDIIVFAVSANFSGISFYVCNDQLFGYITIPLEKDSSLEIDKVQLTNIKLEITVENNPLEASNNLNNLGLLTTPVDNMGLDKIYIINLARRTERYKRMLYCMTELGLSATFIEATDGKAIKDIDLDLMGVKLLPGYKDPYYKRPITKGEIGCFMSHYRLWAMITAEGLDEVLILEDDIRFEPYFRFKLQAILEELRRLGIPWDLVYIGRKPLEDSNEVPVENSKYLIYPGYSYWTLGYLISGRGAKKLLDADPLKKLLPVDEFLPIMFNQHPRNEWLSQFIERNLLALSASPLLIYPIRYTYDEGYVSDTEDSVVITTKDYMEQDNIKVDL
ncbi:glycosyltransferase 25 family member [Daktulosphaira vitifoliae]|uniref:glycosyltransferase 25 family member n=1 Tax=Daktulosphaira vitifoliae TaxID=58002 RepID=UPI0021AAE12E|nr:glycosyltransferase 25 family member [Daktulosphaira vitifoliae]